MRRRTACTMALSLGALVMATARAEAQLDVQILTNRDAQQELRLSPQQVPAVQLIASQVKTRFLSARGALMREAQGDDFPARMEELARSVHTDASKALAEVLVADQMHRYEQIYLQQLGPWAFDLPEVQATLKLTGDQKSRARKISGALAEQSKQFLRGAQGDPAAAAQQMRAAYQQSLYRLVATLNDEQKNLWKLMVGTPFEMR